VNEVSAPITAEDPEPPEPPEIWIEASSSRTSPLPDPPETGQDTAAPSPLLDELGSELSELTDDEPARRLWASEDSVREPTPQRPVQVGSFLPGGTLVWAKAPYYPFWPAVVYEEDDSRVPRDVLQSYSALKTSEKSAGQRTYIVQFYDSKHSWIAVAQSEVRLLGEDDSLDQSMLDARFKNQKLRSECEAAYEQAKAEMDV